MGLMVVVIGVLMDEEGLVPTGTWNRSKVSHKKNHTVRTECNDDDRYFLTGADKI